MFVCLFFSSFPDSWFTSRTISRLRSLTLKTICSFLLNYYYFNFSLVTRLEKKLFLCRSLNQSTDSRGEKMHLTALNLHQLPGCSNAELTALEAPVTGKAMVCGQVCVCVCVDTSSTLNLTTGWRDNILWGQLRVPPTGWRLWQPLIEAQSAELFIQVLREERLPFSQEKLTLSWKAAVYPGKWIQW